MARAFTRELDGDDRDGAEPPRLPTSPYITEEGHRRLVAELERLVRDERPRVTREVADAAAQGDRSENAEYLYGKKRLREIDRRIRYLEKRLDALEVVTTSPARLDRVYFGAWVTVEDGDGERATYRIVGSDEYEPGAGVVSVESPLARALLGKGEGDTVRFVRPRGPCELTVVAVSYTRPIAG